MSEHKDNQRTATAASLSGGSCAGGGLDRQPEFDTSEYTPDITAQYRDEVQALLHSLFADFLRENEPRLHDVLQSARELDAHEGALLIKALQSVGIRFQLTAIAEEIADTRKIRNVEVSSGTDVVIGSFHRALKSAAARGVGDNEVAETLAKLQVVPTITAHKTEAKRVTILENHRQIYLTLMKLETGHWTPFERSRLIDELRNFIAILWMTGELRLERPTTDDEVAWGLHFFNETLIKETQEVRDRLADAMHCHYPDVQEEIPAFLKFRSWIGGDRDGNPSITTDSTRRTLHQYQDNAVRYYIAELERLTRILSISEHVRSPDSQFRQQLASSLEATGCSEEIVSRNPHEPFRQFCVACASRLRANVSRTHSEAVPYAGPDEFGNDLRSLDKALRAIGASGIAASEVASLQNLVSCFGFRTASLDIRQNATVITRTVAELGCDPERSAEALRDGFKGDVEGIEAGSETAEVVALFRLLGENFSDSQALGVFVLSMTSSASDINCVVWLAEALGVRQNFPPIVPLFETFESLRKAPKTLDELLSVEQARNALTDDAGVLEVMLGYAECNKGGGHLSSVWELRKVQQEILAICNKHSVTVRFFHGRGGSISRGGPPTGRAIAALPAGTIQGRLALIEQGEVVSAKYSYHGTTRTYLELLSAGVIAHTLKGGTADSTISQQAVDQMEELSEKSLASYRNLVETPGFMDYFLAASPVGELSSLRTGSALSMRFGAGALDELRAYPWVFGWSQNRHLINGWYGLGTALDARIAAGELEELQAMFSDLKIFRIVIDEVEKALHQTNLEIGARYAALVDDESTRQVVFEKISAEYALTVRHVLSITGQSSIAERFPGFCRRIGDAAPLIDRCNAWQLSLLRRYRADPSKQWNHTPLLLSMNCISTGLGWTG